MASTIFTAASGIALVSDPAISLNTLAIIVAASAFVICGLFLLMAIPVEAESPEAFAPAAQAAQAGGHGAALQAIPPHEAAVNGTGPSAVAERIPYERENAIRFFSIDQISAIRADGHYTMVMRNGTEFFCPWSISRVEQTVQSPPFMRTHRSYLVNLKHVAGFKREGDKAFCLLSEGKDVRIPVSRSRVPDVERALGLG